MELVLYYLYGSFLAIVLNNKNKFIVVKLTVWVWCGVAIMNGQILYVFTDACQQMADMVKQLSYVWLTAETTA